MGLEIFTRSHIGLVPTDESEPILKSIETILRLIGEMEISMRERNSAEARKSIVIAATSFLTNLLVIPVALSFEPKGTDVSPLFRFLDMSPDDLIPAGLSGVFDLAFHLGTGQWPSTWSSKKVGSMRWSVFARGDHALEDVPDLSVLLDVPFVVPTYYDKQGLHLGNDHFPVSVAARRIGATASTAEAAIPVLLNSNFIAHLPDIVAERFLATGELKRILPKECPAYSADVYLSAKADSVPQSLFRGLQDRITKALHR